MSCKSFASSSMRSAAGSVRLGGVGGATQHELVLDALYERKRDKKSVRVLTVIVYVFCVSLAAIMLSLYYVFFWEPKDAQYAQRKVSHTVDQKTSTTPMPTCLMPHTGGSNIAVNDSLSYTTTNNTNGLAVTSEMPASTVTGPTGLPDTTLPTHYKNNNINETNSTLVVGVDNETSVT